MNRYETRESELKSQITDLTSTIFELQNGEAAEGSAEDLQVKLAQVEQQLSEAQMNTQLDKNEIAELQEELTRVRESAEAAEKAHEEAHQALTDQLKHKEETMTELKQAQIARSRAESDSSESLALLEAKLQTKDKEVE